MENKNIIIVLDEEEVKGLEILAKNKRRTPEDEAAILVRRSLEEYGLIPWHPRIPASFSVIEDDQEGRDENSILREEEPEASRDRITLPGLREDQQPGDA